MHPKLETDLTGLSVTVQPVPDVPTLLAHDLLTAQVASLTASSRAIEEALRSTAVDEEPFKDERSLDALISNAVLAACQDLVGDDVRLGSRSPNGLPFDHFNLAVPLEDASLSEATPRTDVVDWQTYETYEGGTLLVRAAVPCELELSRAGSARATSTC